jgi:hypothetical protein
MAGCELTLSAEERGLLVRLLQTELGNTRSELHHTDFSFAYRQDVKKELELLRGLLDRLGAASPAP